MYGQALLSAAEIAAMRLKGLPTTKGKIIERAALEGWYFETRKGRGGTRRVYRLPTKYIPDVGGAKLNSLEAPPRSGKVDLELLSQATRALAEHSAGGRMSPTRTAEIIAVLYDYLNKGANSKEVERMLKALAV
ncbi:MULTISPECIES: hypothetical protein [Pandoraea]|uniref:hypothetical protein n=1 Tax=Pandoraea TaxID=93217 RepID=UPI0012423387|nr:MULTISPECIES: hypothetical protein [Pandoraea]